MQILVVTEIRLYRDGVAAALRALPDVRSANTAADGADAVNRARQHECNVVLLDMAISDSTQAARALKAARRGIHVVALGVREDGPEVISCAEIGVAGYVSRDASLDELAEALRAAMRGEVRCSPAVTAGLVRHIAEHAGTRLTAELKVPLTRREREVVKLLEADMSNKQIARALDLQLSTVKNHVHNVLTKLDASGRDDIPTALARLNQDPVPRPRQP